MRKYGYLSESSGYRLREERVSFPSRRERIPLAQQTREWINFSWASSIDSVLEFRLTFEDEFMSYLEVRTLKSRSY